VGGSDADDFGGLVGNLQASGEVTRTYANGTVRVSSNRYDGSAKDKGGLIGDSAGTVSLSYAAVETNGGGLIGRNDGAAAVSYYDTIESGVESSSYSGVTGLTTSKMSGSFAEDNMAGFDFSESGSWDLQGGDYPSLAWEDGQLSDSPSTDTVVESPVCGDVSYAGTGTENDPYLINNVGQLQCINDNQIDGPGPRDDYQLTSDIDATGTPVWNDGSGFEPIGSFTGSFDGAGYEINGLTIARGDSQTVGLFGSAEAPIEDVTLTDADISGGENTGALVGDYTGTIEDVTVTESDVSGGSSTGGMVGSLDGDVRSSSVESSSVSGSGTTGGVVGEDTADSTIVSSDADVALSVNGRNGGGLIGVHQGSITQSYASGSIDSFPG
jgi:hypothetical protein